MSESYFIGYDVGTGGSKAVLVNVAGEIVAKDFEPYEVSFPAQHCAEQDPVDWWGAVCANAKRLVAGAGIQPDQVGGISFSSQMLGVLPMSADGQHLCPAIIWMDCRAEEQARRIVHKLGGPKVVLSLFGAVPSGKDVICKLLWMRENEPDIWKRTHVFLDVKGYMVYRATGNFLMDQTGASVTGFMHKKTRGWDQMAARLLKIDLAKMPPVKPCAEVVGGLTGTAAEEMGLPAGTPVIAGMGDAPAAAIGAGATEHGDGAISIGTSGLLLITIEKRVNLGRFGIASTAAADPSMWL
ncbi:MAG: FGGY family carbohydrate kinase, partial [Candidatus Geothermincolia bacterium]